MIRSLIDGCEIGTLFKNWVKGDYELRKCLIFPQNSQSGMLRNRKMIIDIKRHLKILLIVFQAAAAAQVRTYRDNGVKHSNSSYNRVGSALDM